MIIRLPPRQGTPKALAAEDTWGLDEWAQHLMSLHGLGGVYSEVEDKDSAVRLHVDIHSGEIQVPFVSNRRIEHVHGSYKVPNAPDAH